MAEPPTTPGFDWPVEQVRAFLRVLTESDSSEEVKKAATTLIGMSHGTYWLNRGAASDEYMKNLKQAYEGVVGVVAGSMAGLANGTYGVPMDAGEATSVGTGGAGKGTQYSAGTRLVDLIFAVFDVAGVREGYKTRLAGDAERNNFARFVGVNWQLQVADMLANFVASALPWNLGDGITSVGEGLQKMLGLEDAQEEILQPLMEKLITEGLIKQFNRDTKPTDLTLSDAIAMRIRDMIGEQTFHAILDNEGVRDDVRQNLLDLNAKNLAQGDAQDLYWRGAWQPSDLLAYFRSQGFLQRDAQLKVGIVESDRLWKLNYQLADVYEAQVVKGIIQESEYEGFLRQLLYSADEVSVLLDTVRRKKTLTAATTAKRITGSFNITPERVKEGGSAIIKWNIRNADTILITDLGSVGPRGEEPLVVDRSRTYTLTASNDAGEEVTFPAYVEVRGTPEVKLPRVSLSLSPRSGPLGSLRELRWNVSNAESVTVDGVLVAPQGVLFPTPFLPTFYTLIATNQAGTVSTQDVALIEFPFDGIDPSVKPSVTFAISPLVVAAAQPRVEIKWGTQNSDSQTLTYPDGRTISVGANGAQIEVITASGVFTFRAKNAKGEVARQEAVIVKAPTDEEPPPPPGGYPPTVSLLGYPQTVQRGATVTLSWFIGGANEGELLGLRGVGETVGQTGSKQVELPGVPGTYIFGLRATNSGGTASASLPIVVQA